MKNRKKWLWKFLPYFAMGSMLIAMAGCGDAPKEGDGSVEGSSKVESSAKSSEESKTQESSEQGSEAETQSTEENVPVSSEEPETPVKKYDDSLIGTMYELKGEALLYYDEGYEYEYDYNFRVPEILDDTEGAKAINKEIRDNYKDYIEKMEKAAEDNRFEGDELYYVMEFCEIKYDTYWNDGLLSLLITMTPYFEDNSTYIVYNYDAESGKVMSNEEMVKRAGMNTAQYTDGIRRAGLYQLDQHFRDFYSWEMPMENATSDMLEDNVQQMYVTFLKDRSRAIQDLSDLSDNPMLMMEGKLYTIGEIPVPAGVGSATDFFEPMGQENARDFSGSVADGIILNYKDGKMTLRFEQGDWAEYVLNGTRTELGKEYSVNGIFKNYVDYRVVYAGNGVVPYLVFLSDDGYVASMDLDTCIQYGYFSVNEPIWYCYDITGFEEDQDEELPMNLISAVRADGTGASLNDILYSYYCLKYDKFNKEMMSCYGEEGYRAERFHPTEGYGYESQYDIRFDTESGFLLMDEFVPDAELIMSYEGYVSWLGMNEHGLILGLNFPYLNGEWVEDHTVAVLGFSKHDYWDYTNDCEDDGATVVHLGGDDLFDSQGEPVVLMRSIG